MATKEIDGVGDLPHFDCSDSAGLAQRWKRWLRAFELYVVGRGVTDNDQKKALLLHKAGMNVQDIYYTLPAVEGEQDEYTKAVGVLSQYFTPQANIPFERHVFRSMTQSSSETIEQFITRLRQQCEICAFGNLEGVNEQIRDQVIDKCQSTKLRRKLLERGTALTLNQLRDISRVFEDTEKQLKSMEGGNANVNKLSLGHRSNSLRGQRGNHGNGGFANSRKCYACGYEGHISKDPKCPAQGRKCRKCKGIGHFEACCKTKTLGRQVRGRGRGGKKSSRSDVKQVIQSGDEEYGDEYAFSVGHGEFHDSDAEIEVVVGGIPLIMSIDSGATVNVVDRQIWEKLKSQGISCTSKRCTRNVYPYGSKQTLPVAGTFRASMTVRDATIDAAEFVVIEGEGQALLGRRSALELGVLKLGPNIHAVKSEDKEIFDIRRKFSECFSGFGKLKDFQLTIPVDRDVTPVAAPMRRIPYHLRDKLEAKLDELEKLDIIEKVNGPSVWVSPVVVVPKGSSEIRLCVDMRIPNEAVKRVPHMIPTIDEVLQDLNQSRVFSKLDIKWAYHQIELAPESREITTFITHKGLYRYKRLMFGITCAPEMYQKVLQQILQDCEGAHNIMDDIIVHASTVEEHDRRLAGVLQVIKEKGLTLNPDKCLFKLPKLEFMGHVLSSRGLSPTDEKVKAIVKAREPENASEVRSFLGLVNYTGRFIENLATISEPLRRLTRKGETFEWGPDQQRSFSELKRRLGSAETLAYFDKNAKTQVIADASPVGLGAVLVQTQNGENRVICYASRSLTDVERRYSQTEKEALSLVWACERFHPYLYGAEFELLTDHKPLEFIYSPRSKPSARIERWVLRMQPYMYTVKHIPGRNNVADCLSRLLSTDKSDYQQSSDAEEYVKFVAKEATPVALTTKDIERASDKDPELVEVRNCIRTGHWNRIECKQYVPIRKEISAVGKLVLRGSRIVIPLQLREQVLSLAHEGHPGIVSMKQRLRTKVWWPGIDRQAEQFCRTCYGCQLVAQPSPPTPMSPTDLPSAPWQHLAADLLGPLPSGDYIFVVVDYYSRFFEIRVTKNTTAEKIVALLASIFLTHGLSLSIQTDNGPQFVSEHFRHYITDNGIVHRKTTPLWPQANGEVERQNRSILKRIKIAQAERQDWKTELNHYLMMYRSTPHTSTGKSPAELLFGRTIRTKIPEIQEFQVEDSEVRDRDSEQKGKGKEYADKRRRACESEIQEGDSVLLQQNRENKLSTSFNPKPFTVLERNGNSVLIKSDQGVKYRRNITAVRKFHERKSDSVNVPKVSNVPNVPNVPCQISVRRSDIGESESVENECKTSGKSPDSHTPVKGQPQSATASGGTLNSSNSERPCRQRKLPAKFDDFIVGQLMIRS